MKKACVGTKRKAFPQSCITIHGAYSEIFTYIAAVLNLFETATPIKSPAF